MENEFTMYKTLSGGGLKMGEKKDKIIVKPLEKQKKNEISDEDKDRIKRLRDKISTLEQTIQKIESKYDK